MAVTIDGTAGVTAPNLTSTTSSTLASMTQALNLGSTGQIVFPATQNASSDANTLDDYEEGTVTLTWTGATAPTTPPTATGRYIKIGKLVTVAARFENSNLTGGGGEMRVTGLPFTVVNALPDWVGSCSFYSIPLPTNTKWVNSWPNSNSTYISFFATLDNAFWTAVQCPSASGKYMELNVTYETSA